MSLERDLRAFERALQAGEVDKREVAAKLLEVDHKRYWFVVANEKAVLPDRPWAKVSFLLMRLEDERPVIARGWATPLIALEELDRLLPATGHDCFLWDSSAMATAPFVRHGTASLSNLMNGWVYRTEPTPTAGGGDVAMRPRFGIENGRIFP